jgi:hypothetical protein
MAMTNQLFIPHKQNHYFRNLVGVLYQLIEGYVFLDARPSSSNIELQRNYFSFLCLSSTTVLHNVSRTSNSSPSMDEETISKRKSSTISLAVAPAMNKGGMEKHYTMKNFRICCFIVITIVSASKHGPQIVRFYNLLSINS